MAVKVLRPSLAADETIVARFSREAGQHLHLASHALSVTDFGEAEFGVVFLVMGFGWPYVEEVIRAEGRCRWPEGRDYAKSAPPRRARRRGHPSI